MLSFLPPTLRGVIAATLLIINTIFWCSVLFAFVIGEAPAAAPAGAGRGADRILNALATCWVACNSGWMRLTQRTQWSIAGQRRTRVQGLVPRQLQSPVVGGHPRAAARAQPAHPDAQVLPQAAAHLCAGHRARVVGARLSLHAAAFRRLPPVRIRRNGTDDLQAARTACREIRAAPGVARRISRKARGSRRRNTKRSTRPTATC